TITTSPARAACSTVTGVAPVSVAKSDRVSGPLEFATKTLCPSALKRRVSVPPMLPAPIIPIFMSCYSTSYQVRFLDVQIRWNLPPLRVREIFRYPKVIVFPSRCIAGDRLCNLLALERTDFHSSEVLPSQVLHFGAAWEIGRPFARNNNLWSAKRSCGLLE